MVNSGHYSPCLRKLDRPNNLDTDYLNDVVGRVTRIKPYNGLTTIAYSYDKLARLQAVKY